MRKIAFSDIHGCAKTFQALLEKVAPDSDDHLFFLGDYIDRGPDSKGVIDRIMALEREGFTVHSLRGNHEQMFFESADDPELDQIWMLNGGADTLHSFRILHTQDLAPIYQQWMSQLGFFLEVDEYILVHAGLNFFDPDPLQDTYSMLWIREWYPFIDYAWLADRIIIHGHTPITTSSIRLQLNALDRNRYLDIDAGCVHKGKRPGLTDLCAFDMTNRVLFFQKNFDF